MKVYYRQVNPDTWENEYVRFEKLTSKVGNMRKLIMYPSTHDIHPIHLEHHIYFIRKLLVSGNKVLIVSKPHLKCIDRICEEFQQYKSQILFRFTIGSKDDEVLRFWEPKAPLFKERLGSLILSSHYGYRTSVSCEPLLDSNPDGLINMIQEYVNDSIWIGRGNLFSRRTSMNGWKDQETKRRISELKEWMDDYDHMFSIYLRHKDDPLIRWKDSLRRQLRIEENSWEQIL